MPIRIFRNISALSAQRFSESNTTKFGGSVERVASGIKRNRDSDDAVDIKASEGLHPDDRIFNIKTENLSAADSTITETDIAKEIAILTRKYILETASIYTKK